MKNIKDLIGTELEFEGKNLKVTNAKIEWGNIVLTTEEVIVVKNREKTYSFSEQSLRLFKNVHPNLVKIMKAAITNSPYDFRITAGARTAEEQNALYQMGRTRNGAIVTKADGYRNKSNHQIKSDGYGHAVDIFVCGKYDENGNYVKFTSEQGYESSKMKEVADHIKATAKSLGLHIEWGGDWKFYDSPHFQV